MCREKVVDDMAFEKKVKTLSWEDIEKLIGELGSKIRASGFNPDYLIGITVGGLIPLALLAAEFNIKNILTVSAGSYKKDKQGQLNVMYVPEVDLEGKKVLLVDEVADSGETLRGVSRVLIDKCNIQELKTVVISINKEKCTFRPDFFAIEESGWVAFPWEKKEFPEYFKN